MPHHAYFFDFDHTLFDSDASESLAFAYALTSNRVEPSEDLFSTYKAINHALWRDVETGVRDPNQVRTLRFDRLVNEADLDLDPTALADAFTTGMQESGDLYPGAADVLNELRKRGPLVMVTNAISEIQRRRIARLGIEPLFDAIVISSEIGSAKPASGIFDTAMEFLSGIDRASTLMVGDSLTSDIAGGIAAGLATCWFNPNGKTRDPLLRIDHEITDLNQLLAL